MTFERRDAEYRDGFGLATLCAKCNHTTGARYGDAYAAFVRQFDASGSLQDPDGRRLVSLRKVRPLRVVKQMYSMFLSVQSNPDADRWDGLRDFVRRRDAVLGDFEFPRVYLYQNASKQGRIFPLGAMGELHRAEWEPSEPVVCSEVSWPPVGIVFALSRPDYFSAMAEITEWGRYCFDETKTFMLRVPSLKVESDWPLGFGSPREVDDWSARRGIMWAIGASDDKDAPTSIGMTLRRAGR